MSNIWVTSDEHYCHKNIIKYSNRPFNSVSEMNETLIKNFNQVVGKNDLTIHVGDFCLSSKVMQKEILTRLNGRHWLIWGNHDSSKSRMLEIGFEKVFHTLIKDGIIFHHVPIFLDGRLTLNVSVDVWNFFPIPLPTVIQPMVLCGHVHDKWIYK